ncbi:uncharacterized protein, partial [Cebidichthys violaceus]|uniref:uncharacterized protein n=1 Tax=Cebidichthys violaceus TaxID=271503 RepID=UPI0035C9E844
HFEGRDHAAAFLQYRVTPDELIDRIMSYMEKKTPNQVNLAVDVGCGSGQRTILLAPYFTKVVGTDVSPAHWFNREKFLLEADRVLRPGGCLALLSYSMKMELEYGDVSNGTLNDICNEFYPVLHLFRNPYLEKSSSKIYSDMFDSCSYPNKEWNECLRVKRTLPLSGYFGMIETYSSYQKMLQMDPAEAERLSNDVRNKLMSVMKVSSPDTEVTVVVKYFYWLARKPL